MMVARICRIDADGRIAHDCLGTRRRYDDVILSTLDEVAEIVELALMLLEDNLLVRECRLCLGIPVDHAYPTVDESLLVELAEDIDDRLRALLI